MKVSNIEVTPIRPDRWGDDLDVVNAARVSFSKESEWEYVLAGPDEHGHYEEKVLSEQDKKLINYLAKHKHHSPFNHSFLRFRIKAPIFVARQLQKHKFMPWNEVSRRYVDDEPEFYFPSYWRKKADNVKQGSSDDEVDLDEAICPHDVTYPEWAVNDAVKCYNGLLGAGVCPEQARMVLPQNMMTEWVWSGTLGAFLDMLVLRLDGHTQRETQEVARLIAAKVKELFPVSYNAYLGEA